MKRGFKSWCETIATKYRKELDLKNSDQLDPIVLAKYLKIPLLTPTEINGIDSETTRQLLITDQSSWSAVAIAINNSYLVIYNPSHSSGRKANNIMHELAHIIIGHKPNQTFFSSETGLFLRYFEQEQEEEADWLAATLLLPREALILAKRQQQDIHQISEKFCVSPQLVTMRLNISGVNKIFQRTKVKAKD